MKSPFMKSTGRSEAVRALFRNTGRLIPDHPHVGNQPPARILLPYLSSHTSRSEYWLALGKAV